MHNIHIKYQIGPNTRTEAMVAIILPDLLRTGTNTTQAITVYNLVQRAGNDGILYNVNLLCYTREDTRQYEIVYRISNYRTGEVDDVMNAVVPAYMINSSRGVSKKCWKRTWRISIYKNYRKKE